MIARTVLTILALLLLAATGWWWTGPSSDELIVYPARCTNLIQILPFSLAMQFGESFEKIRADRENCVILDNSPTVYKLNKTRGEVYYAGHLDQPRRLINCSILSRTDWTCSYSDGSGKVVIIDGLRAIHRDDVKRPAKPGRRNSAKRPAVLFPTTLAVVDRRIVVVDRRPSGRLADPRATRIHLMVQPPIASAMHQMSEVSEPVCRAHRAAF